MLAVAERETPEPALPVRSERDDDALSREAETVEDTLATRDAEDPPGKDRDEPAEAIKEDDWPEAR